MGAVSPRLDRAELTRVDTRFARTVLAVLRHGITGNRAVLTRGADHLDDISVVDQSRRLALGKTDSLSDNLSLFINTTAKLRCRRDQAHCDVVSLFLQLACKRKLCHLVEHIMFDSNHIFISIHRVLPRSFLIVNFLTNLCAIISDLWGISSALRVFL